MGRIDDDANDLIANLFHVFTTPINDGARRNC